MPSLQSAPWSRAFTNLRREHSFEPLRVEGNLPPELCGTYHRNGGGRFDASGDRFGHWFDADGAMTGVKLEGGKAFGAVKLARTPGLRREERAGKRLFGGYNTRLRRPLRELFLHDSKNRANTSVMHWQGRLFALCENGVAFELEEKDLSSLGETDLGCVKVGAFSAHPHYAPQRRAIYNFGITYGPRVTVTAYELPDRGPARAIASFGAKGPTMVHDFAVTERHLVFSMPPMRMAMWPLLTRRVGPVDSMRWYADEGAEIVVIPLDDPTSIVRFRAPAHLAEHFANAFERDGMIHADFVHYENMRGIEDYVGSLTTGLVKGPLGSKVVRMSVDPKKKSARFEDLLSTPCELPTVSPRVDAQSHRYMYLAGFSSDEASRTGPFDAILKLDVESGAVEKFFAGPSKYAGEAVFVPKADAVTEDDGYLLSLVWDAESDHTFLAVLSARDPSSGPIASAHFDHAIPPGFHGKWTPRVSQ
jgi:all-trans-8'-apo-beta-carotenal 15,15'-oxygenase